MSRPSTPPASVPPPMSRPATPPASVPPPLDPRSAPPSLHLSGSLITAALGLPSLLAYQPDDGSWRLRPRPGSSALFDALSHLSSSQSPWKHTLVAWTGEVESLAPHSSASPDLSELRIPRRHRDDVQCQLEKQHAARVVPVWLDETDANAASNDDTVLLRRQHRWRRYAEEELFRLFHYRQNEPTDGRAVAHAWRDYVRMNEAFADAIADVYRPGDLVCVHDYHLFLVPALLRHRIPTVALGFFLHIPFPSSEYFRCLTRRKELLDGVLGANMIGFQAFTYAGHFASSCRRVAGLDASHAGVDAAGAHVAIGACPIGIDAAATLRAAFDDPKVDAQVRALRHMYAGKKIVVGRDRLDAVRGVAQKLQAFELFLQRHPEWRGRVVLIQVTSSPTAGVERDRDRTAHHIAELVAHINGTWGSLSFAPVHYHPQYLARPEYLALLRVADVALLTSVRDGVNTAALEYVLCQRDTHGPLLLSEFSGTAGTLPAATPINPWDLHGTADALARALELPADARRTAHAALYPHVTKGTTVQAWTDRYLRRLVTTLAAGETTATATPPPLDRARLLARYRTARRRLFMFDYDGTLTPIVRDPQAAVPSDRVMRNLKALAADPRNRVYIISGRDQAFLDEWMGHIPALGLSAEHGSFERAPHRRAWHDHSARADVAAWQPDVLAIFCAHAAAAPGAFIERKKVALVWHHRGCDPAVGAAQAARCRAQLERDVLPRHDVDILPGKANVEVRPRFVNKGEMVRALLAPPHRPDFVLCLGDDVTDEGVSPFLLSPSFRSDPPLQICSAPSAPPVCPPRTSSPCPSAPPRNLPSPHGTSSSPLMSLH